MSSRAGLGGRATRAGVAGVVLMAVWAAACSNETVTAPTSSTQLDGTWRLSQMTASGSVHNEALTAGRFDVTFATGRIEAKADCNRCAGAASLSGAMLTMSPLACTRAACASAPLDTRFASLLDGTVTVRVNQRLLQLNSSLGELRFER